MNAETRNELADLIHSTWCPRKCGNPSGNEYRAADAIAPIFDAAIAEAEQRALRQAADALNDDQHSTNDPGKAFYHGVYAAWLNDRADAHAAQPPSTQGESNADT